MARLRIGTRQQRLRGRELGHLEAKPITEDFASKVRQDSISRLARMKQQTDKQKAMETGENVPQVAKPPRVAKPASKVLPSRQPPPELPQVGSEGVGLGHLGPVKAAPKMESLGTLVPGQGLDVSGPGPGAGTDTSGMISMADTAFGASPLGIAIGKGLAKGAKGFLGKVSPIPFTGTLLEKAKPDLFSYEPTQKGWNARGQQVGLSGPVGTSAGGVGPPSAVGGGAAAGFGNASTPGSISGGGHSPGTVSSSALGSMSMDPGMGGGFSGSTGAGLGAIGGPAGAAPPGTPGAVGGTMGAAGAGAGTGGGGPCIIISACTDPHSYEVDVTRAFRDEHLTGPMLRGYYALARRVVPWLERSRLFKAAVKRLLVDRLIDYGEYILDLKPHREKTGSEAVSLAFLGLIGWIGKRKEGR